MRRGRQKPPYRPKPGCMPRLQPPYWSVKTGGADPSGCGRYHRVSQSHLSYSGICARKSDDCRVVMVGEDRTAAPKRCRSHPRRFAVRARRRCLCARTVLDSTRQFSETGAFKLDLPVKKTLFFNKFSLIFLLDSTCVTLLVAAAHVILMLL